MIESKKNIIQKLLVFDGKLIDKPISKNVLLGHHEIVKPKVSHCSNKYYVIFAFIFKLLY